MRVAYLINHYPSISHSFIRREIAALEAQGVEVLRFALRGWDETLVDPRDKAELARTRHTLRNGVRGLLLGLVRRGLRQPKPVWRALKLALSMARRSVRPWPYHLVYLAHASQLLEWIEAENASGEIRHLHAHFGTNSTEIAALVQALGGPKFSFTIHGSEVFDDPTRHALPIKTEAACAAVTSCAYIGSQLMYHLPPDLWDKVEVIHCGLDDTAFSQQSAPLPDHPVFLCIGRLSPEKGHLLAVDAFAKVHAQHPEARLVLIGDGPMRDALVSRIAELGLQDAVDLAGWASSDEVRRALRQASALVHPSFTEGLPVVIMEAMAESRPVISTYIAGIPELVRDGETGWLVPAGRVPELAEAILACAVSEPKQLEKMGAAGLARVRARHSVMHEAARLKALFAAPGGE